MNILASVAAAITHGLMKVNEHNAFGEPHYQITPSGRAYGRARSAELGLDSDSLRDYELFSIIVGGQSA